MRKERRFRLLKKANQALGRELMDIHHPEIFGHCLVFIGKRKGLQLCIRCSESAKQKVLGKYGTHYNGFKLYFTISGSIVFARQPAREGVAV